MAYTKLIYHIVFRPHGNVAAIPEKNERELYMYVYGFCKQHNCLLYRIGGMPDHIHILVSLHPALAVASFVHDLKIATGNFMRRNKDKFPLFPGWERGYGAFTCSESEKENVINYIARQKEHHCRVSARDEFVSLLNMSRVPYDERYV